MPVLPRKINETLVIDERVKVTVAAVGNNRVRLGIDAPLEVSLVRGELLPLAPLDQRAAPDLRASSALAPPWLRAVP